MSGNSEHYRISILLMEDNELTRVAIRSMLDRVGQFEIVGEATDAETALPMVANLKPQVVLADIGLPGMDGVQATKRIKQDHPGVKVIMLTSHDRGRDVFDAFDAGADGYIIKEAFSNRLELAIKSVREGTTWLDPRIARLVLDIAAPRLRAAAVSGAAGGHAGNSQPEQLSEQETTILVELASDEPACKDGVCSIDPNFLQRLHRFANKPAQGS